MADIIQLLPDHVANQIAAGEVVQRPASVVKELMENAIDADASVIQLIVKDAGKSLILVVDNGSGMSSTDARLSLERHATSKIKTASDLFNINTKGFRGEALASIAAIAHLEMKSRLQHDPIGTIIRVEGSKVLSQEDAAVPSGTSIAVKNLFFNVPARRNFLKSDQVELRHIIDEFHRVALAHPCVEFKFYHNDSEMFNLPVSKLRKRIVSVFGSKTNEKLVPVGEETEVVRIGGFVGKPQFARKTRGEQFFFVNDRFIKSPYLNHAVNSAFEGLLKEGAHASYFLYLEVDPQGIDVNIHPTKTEIKFEDEHTIYAILRAAVRHSLGQFSIAPVLDFERDASMDTPYSYKGKTAMRPEVDVDQSFNPFSKEIRSTPGQGFKKHKQADWESLYVGLESKSNQSDGESSHFEVESDPDSVGMFGQEHTIAHFKTFQVQNKYIIKPIKSGLVIINQHRAHQRILYESFLEEITVNAGVSQQLMFPKQLHYSRPETAVIRDLRPQLEQAGFVFECLDDEAIEINGIPSAMAEEKVSDILDSLIRDVQQQVPGASFSQSDLIAKSLAKSMAIKSGKHLGSEEREFLIDKLFFCKEPDKSPFSKPVFVTLRAEDLEKFFI